MRSAKPIILFVLGICVALAAATRLADAAPIGAPTLNSTNVLVGDTTTVTAHWGPDEPNGTVARLIASGPGVFTGASVVVNSDSTGVVEDKVVTITDDEDANAEPLTTVQATFECGSTGTVTFVLEHNGVAVSAVG